MKRVVLHGNPASQSIYKGGKTYNFGLSLGELPTATVTVTLSSRDSKFTLSTASLTFTTSNWMTPQYLTVTAVNDSVVDGVYYDALQISASGGGYSWSANKRVSIVDNVRAERTIRKGYPIKSELTISTQAQANTMRSALIDFLTNGDGLPTTFTPDETVSSYTGSVHTAGANTAFTYSILTRYKWILVDEDAYDHVFYGYHFVAPNSNSRLIISNEGHGAAAYDVMITAFLADGFDVLHLGMPVEGNNTTTNPSVSNTAADASDHNTLKNIATSTYDPLGLFVLPGYIASKYMASLGYSDRVVTGISGGGTGNWVSILDTDISKTFNFRASQCIKAYLLDGSPASSLDYENWSSVNTYSRALTFMSDKNWPDLFLLQCDGGRTVYNYIHTGDTVTDYEFGWTMLEELLEARASALGGTCVLWKDVDASRNTHQYYTDSANRILAVL